MFDEDMVMIEASSDNLKRLLECKEKLAPELQSLIDSIISMELNIMYIETAKICLPIIEEFNKVNSRISNKKVVSLVNKDA